tara:strand:+ start:377 stop:1102 length:726 start_codon:yes stop_codon:yes gene_type:complete
MAKDLPYFKFFCSEWNDGDITLETFEHQGLFINICSYYWSNECNVNLDKLLKRFKGSKELINDLIDANLFKINKDKTISITFLDEQAEDRGKLCSQNAKNAKKRWDKKRKESDRNATASIPQCENNAIKKREEEIREEKIIIKEITDDFDKYRKRYSTYAKKLFNNNAWIESISRMFVKDKSNDVNIKTIDKYLRLFLTHLEVIREKHEKENDFTKHFSSWMRIQPTIIKVYPKEEQIRYS